MSDGNSWQNVRVFPFEFTTAQNLIGFGPEYVATYSCNDCGYYGPQGGGLHPYAWTRTPNPNCTVTDPLWALLNGKNITKKCLTLIDQTGCEPLYQYLANCTSSSTTQAPSTTLAPSTTQAPPSSTQAPPSTTQAPPTESPPPTEAPTMISRRSRRRHDDDGGDNQQ